MAAAMNLELHSCDLSQAFIQADKLDEGVNGRIFIRPPQGAIEDPDTVFEGFVTAWFEDSVWVREAGGRFAHRLIVSAHIDDTLMACKSIETLQDFKKLFLTRQAVYACKILQLYCAWDKPTVKTQLEPGVRLSKVDSPEVAGDGLGLSREVT
eukprot:515143-Rhodomonas_salina.1